MATEDGCQPRTPRNERGWTTDVSGEVERFGPAYTGPTASMQPHYAGEYVRFSDHEAVTQKLEERIKRADEEIGKLEDAYERGTERERGHAEKAEARIKELERANEAGIARRAEGKKLLERAEKAEAALAEARAELEGQARGAKHNEGAYRKRGQDLEAATEAGAAQALEDAADLLTATPSSDRVPVSTQPAVPVPFNPLTDAPCKPNAPSVSDQSSEPSQGEGERPNG